MVTGSGQVQSIRPHRLKPDIHGPTRRDLCRCESGCIELRRVVMCIHSTDRHPLTQTDTAIGINVIMSSTLSMCECHRPCCIIRIKVTGTTKVTGTPKVTSTIKQSKSCYHYYHIVIISIKLNATISSYQEKSLFSQPVTYYRPIHHNIIQNLYYIVYCQYVCISLLL